MVIPWPLLGQDPEMHLGTLDVLQHDEAAFMVYLEENRDTGRNVEPLRCDRQSHLPAIREQGPLCACKHRTGSFRNDQRPTVRGFPGSLSGILEYGCYGDSG